MNWLKVLLLTLNQSNIFFNFSFSDTFNTNIYCNISETCSKFVFNNLVSEIINKNKIFLWSCLGLIILIMIKKFYNKNKTIIFILDLFYGFCITYVLMFTVQSLIILYKFQ